MTSAMFGRQPAAPAAPAPATAPNLYVLVNGQPTGPMPVAQALAGYPPATQVCPEGGSAWVSLASFAPVAPPPVAALPPPPPAPPAAPQAPAAPAAARPGFGSFARPATTPAATGAPAMRGAPTTSGASEAPQGLFAKVGGAEIYRKNDYIEEGDYIARILKPVFHKGREKNRIIIEMEIVTSSYDAANPSNQACNQVGEKVSHFVALNDSFDSNMKEIMLAVSGVDAQGKPRPETDIISEEECQAFVSKENPYAGALVYIEARKKTSKRNTEYTNVHWWPCPLLPDGQPDVEKLMREIR